MGPKIPSDEGTNTRNWCGETMEVWPVSLCADPLVPTAVAFVRMDETSNDTSPRLSLSSLLVAKEHRRLLRVCVWGGGGGGGVMSGTLTFRVSRIRCAR